MKILVGLKTLMFLALHILFTNAVNARDFGVQGQVFKIEEVDMLEFIANRLNELERSGELALKQAHMKERAKQYINKPPAVVGVTHTIKARMWEFDPTYILEDDIKDHEGKLIHAKGTTVNPLLTTALPHNLIFIDGDDKSQIKWGISEYKKQTSKLILVKGSPTELMKQQKLRFYFDQKGALTKRLGIIQVPAVVSQKGLKLLIQEIKLGVTG